MHLTHPLLLLLPALATSQDIQKPLLEQATSYLSSLLGALPTTVPAVPAALKSPIASSTSKLASLTIHPLTISNYETLLTPDPSSSQSPQEWMIFISGGNKTCGGHCARLETEFNKTAVLLAADPTAPTLGFVNCDRQGALCSTWMAKPPTIWHIQRPVARADQSTPASTIHINYFNVTHSTAGDMVALHSGKKYQEGILYDGWFDPFDGVLAQWGVNKAIGYVLFGIGMVPSWAFMIVVSMVSRTIISRRNGPNPAVQQQEAQRRAAGRNPPMGGAPPANE